MRASDFKPAPAEASVFHGLAGSFLAEFGFALVNDPSRIFSHYRASAAVYQSGRGVFLSAEFEAGDSNTAGFSCGRRWSAEQQLLFLSNQYSALAKRFGLETPLFYTLGYGEQIELTMKTMLADLRRTLPTVLQRVSMEDLLAVERDEFGAETKARMRFGAEYMQHVEISALITN
jgi:hypothetical protein